LFGALSSLLIPNRRQSTWQVEPSPKPEVSD